MKDSLLKYLIIFLLTFWATHNISLAQDSTNTAKNKSKRPGNFDFNRLFFGGNMGAQFGTYTFVNASPSVGYRVTDNLLLGVGGSYIYMNNTMYNYSNSIYGYRAFGRYLIWENLFAHGEYEILNGQWDYYRTERFNITNILVGGGYRQSVGGRGFLSLTVLWNLGDSQYSPYINPVIRMGFGVGF